MVKNYTRDVKRKRRSPIVAAIAYIGSDVKDVLPLREGDFLICDASQRAIKQGATNARSLTALHRHGVRIFSHEGLHAKVIVCGEFAWVGSAFENELRRLPDKSPLWQVDATVLAALDDALDTLCSLDGVGRTKATKLLARKRPLLAPITDSLVESFYGSKNWNHLRPLAAVLAERRDIIEAFSDMVENVGKRQLSVLRVIDIAIWMTQSNAKSAKEARNRTLGDSAPIRRKA